MQFDPVYLHKFTHHMEVECPQCQQKALVQHFVDKAQILRIRLSCIGCGYGKNFEANYATQYHAPFRFRASNWIFLSEPVDVYFRLPLWYQMPFREKIISAYNKEHLQWLKNYLSENLRERRPDEKGWTNKSLQSRLPKWLLSGKNRTEIVRKLEQLERK